MILLFTAIILYLLYLFLEHRQNEAARRSFLHVIHVNGIRGKTGTCRTLDAVPARGPIFWGLSAWPSIPCCRKPPRSRS